MSNQTKSSAESNPGLPPGELAGAETAAPGTPVGARERIPTLRSSAPPPAQPPSEVAHREALEAPEVSENSEASEDSEGASDPGRFGIRSFEPEVLAEARQRGVPRVPTADFTRGEQEHAELLKAAESRAVAPQKTTAPDGWRNKMRPRAAAANPVEPASPNPASVKPAGVNPASLRPAGEPTVGASSSPAESAPPEPLEVPGNIGPQTQREIQTKLDVQARDRFVSAMRASVSGKKAARQRRTAVVIGGVTAFVALIGLAAAWQHGSSPSQPELLTRSPDRLPSQKSLTSELSRKDAPAPKTTAGDDADTNTGVAAPSATTPPTPPSATKPPSESSPELPTKPTAAKATNGASTKPAKPSETLSPAASPRGKEEGSSDRAPAEPSSPQSVASGKVTNPEPPASIWDRRLTAPKD